MARSKHTLSYYKLLSGDMGPLYPIGLTEVLPNDTFQHQTSVLMRFSPMAAPIMHPITVRIHHFFVPHRLTWPTVVPESGPKTGWEQFITGGEKGDDAQTVPTMTSTVTKGSLLDYLGLPVSAAQITHSALPVRCYNLIWEEWFRDQQLMDERQPEDTTVASIAWEKDPFTSARPSPQLGPAVTLPLGAKAPVKGIGPNHQTYLSPNETIYESGNTQTTTFANAAQIQATATFINQDEAPGRAGWPDIYADLANAEGVSINVWRQAFALQRYAEARNRYGARYTEYLKYLGANTQDFRLQRPELLASGRSQVRISEVLQTANEQTPSRFGVGDLYGHGLAAMRSNRYRRHFNEHGYVMTLLSVRPKSMYMNGTERTWLRRSREEFFQRELQHVGMQEVWNAEILQNGTDDYGTFGWADRYDEYRRCRSSVAGDFRDQLKYWHLARDFGTTRPGLNAQFVTADPSKRIFNVQQEDGLWIAAQHNLVARRMVAKRMSPRVL